METAEFLNKEVLNNARCLVISLNTSGVVYELLCPWGEWSVDSIRIGNPLPEALRAVLNTTPQSRQTRFFPYIYLDETQVVDVHVSTHGLSRKVILRDVSEVHRAELKYQQKAHEVSLLLEKQSELNRQLEIQRTELERAGKAKSRFIASMSHEFRSPIAAIMGHAGLLMQHQQDAEAPAAIQRASWHLLTLVENLLEQARQGEGVTRLNPAPVHLDSLLEDMRNLFTVQAKAKGLELFTAGPPAEIALEADELRLRQVLINLLSNAVRYTREGRVDLDVQTKDGALQFRVIDTGPGIEESDRERIFQPFMRLDTGQQAGAGLGLHITRQLIDAMGGKLELDSEPGRGSTFRFTLPLGAVDAPGAPPDLLKGRSVLLVEDDPDVLAIHQLYMQDLGMQVHSVTSLPEAFVLLEQQRFDLVFTDLHLETGSGKELLQYVQGQGGDSRTILCSGSGVAANWREKLGGIADEFLLKPVPPERLKAAIIRVLSAP
ncbi:MAG: response regulator [Gammaproteobacteria bacterium]|nr:response regulator [Gammaproteobacteria bacterium]